MSRIMVPVVGASLIAGFTVAALMVSGARTGKTLGQEYNHPVEKGETFMKGQGYADIKYMGKSPECGNGIMGRVYEATATATGNKGERTVCMENAKPPAFLEDYIPKKP